MTETQICVGCGQPKSPTCCQVGTIDALLAEKPERKTEPLRPPDGPRCEFCGQPKPATGFCCGLSADRFVKSLYEMPAKAAQEPVGNSLSPVEQKAAVAALVATRKPRSERDEERLERLWRTGRTVEQIAIELDYSPRHIRRLVRQAGLPPRRPGRR